MKLHLHFFVFTLRSVLGPDQDISGCLCSHCRSSRPIISVDALNITPYDEFDCLEFCACTSKIESHKTISKAKDINDLPIEQFSDAVHELKNLRGWLEFSPLGNFILAMNGEFAELAEIVIPILDHCSRNYAAKLSEEISDIVVYAILAAKSVRLSANEILLTRFKTCSLSHLPVDKLPEPTAQGLRSLFFEMLGSIATLNRCSSAYNEEQARSLVPDSRSVDAAARSTSGEDAGSEACSSTSCIGEALGSILKAACRLYAYFGLNPNECLFKKMVYNEYKKTGLHQNFSYDASNRVVSSYVQ